MGVRKGQMFTVGAIIFSSLLLLAGFSYQSVLVQEQDARLNDYFQNLLETQAEVLEKQVSENYTTANVKKQLYSFNTFSETVASEKGSNYYSFQAVIMPEEQEALFINYRNSSTSFDFKTDSWNSYTLDKKQNLVTSISQDREKFRFKSEDLNINETVYVDGPTLIGHIQLKSDRENWQNYIVR